MIYIVSAKHKTCAELYKASCIYMYLQSINYLEKWYIFGKLDYERS